jgi:hypothetical protein
MRALLVRWVTWCQANGFRFAVFYGGLFLGGFLFLTLITMGIAGATFFPDVVHLTAGRAAFILAICLAGGIFWGWKMWAVIEAAMTGNMAAIQAQKGPPLGNVGRLLLWIAAAIFLVMIYNFLNNAGLI